MFVLDDCFSVKIDEGRNQCIDRVVGPVGVEVGSKVGGSKAGLQRSIPVRSGHTGEELRLGNVD